MAVESGGEGASKRAAGRAKKQANNPQADLNDLLRRDAEHKRSEEQKEAEHRRAQELAEADHKRTQELAEVQVKRAMDERDAEFDRWKDVARFAITWFLVITSVIVCTVIVLAFDPVKYGDLQKSAWALLTVIVSAAIGYGVGKGGGKAA